MSHPASRSKLRFAVRRASATAAMMVAILAEPSAAGAQAGPPTPTPPVGPPDGAPPASGVPAAAEVALDDPMLRPPPAPPHVLGTWQEALRLARSQSTELRIATARVEQARGEQRQALAPALPTLTGTGSVSHHLLTGAAGSVIVRDPSSGITLPITGSGRSRIPDPLTSYGADLTLRVPLFAPRSWHDAGTARESVNLAQIQREESQRLLLGATAEAIVSVVTAERLAEVSRVSLRAALEVAQLNRRRAALGAATSVDVLRGDQEVAASRAQVVSSDEELLRAREALGFQLGFAEPWGVTPNIRVDGLARDAAASCRNERDVNARADVRAAARSVTIAERNVRSTGWDHAPTIDASSRLAYLGSERTSPNGEHFTWTIGATLTWVLYDGGLRYGAHRTTRGRLDEAGANLDQARRRAEIELLQAQRGVEVAGANLRIGRESRDIAREQARLTRVAFENGLGTSFDVIDAAQRLRQAEIDLAVREFELVRARLAALLALATCST